MLAPLIAQNKTNTLNTFYFFTSGSSVDRLQYNAFGDEVKFSPDGTMLLVGELLGDPEGQVADTGLIAVINRNGNDWYSAPSHGITLISDLPAAKSYFGHNFVFSHDGLNLIVGNSTSEYNGIVGAGSVKIFDATQFR